MRPLTGSTTPLGRLAMLAAVVPIALLGAACDDASPGQEEPADESEGDDGNY